MRIVIFVMTLQELYTSGILEAFSTYSRLKGLSEKVQKESTVVLLAYLARILQKSSHSPETLLAALQITLDHHQASTQVQECLSHFVQQYPPHQAGILLHQYLLALAKSNCSISTIKNYRSDINQFFIHANESSLEKIITKTKVQAFTRLERESGRAAATIKRKLISLTQFALWLERMGAFPVNSFQWLENFTKEQPTHQDEELGPEVVESANKTRKLETPAYRTNRNSIWRLPVQPEVNPPSPTLHHQEYRNRLSSGLAHLQAALTQKSKQSIVPYVNLALIVLFILGLGFFGYRQFFLEAEAPLAFPNALTRPNRTLSFQGRLTDTAQNPVTSATDFRFKLYDSGPSTTGGTVLWDSNTCSVTPDQDGIFSTGLGDDCGSEIGSDVFSENANVWLQVEVEAEVLDPRQSIKTVAYALNSETLQGYPASASAVENTVLVMNNSGQVVLGNTNPVLKATGTSFAIEANTLTLRTTAGSNGNIVLSPDGLGKVTIQKYLEAPGATLSATYAGGTALVTRGGPSGTANIQEWQNSAGTILSVVNSAGNLGVGTTSTGTNSLQVNGANSLFTHSAALDVRIDNSGTGNASLTIDRQASANESKILFSDAGVTQWGVGSKASTNNFVIRDADSTERLTILKSNGNIGIGTTNPSSFKLQIDGSVGPQTDSTYNLGSASLAWANVYADAFTQNGNVVCDISGNCPSNELWQNILSVYHPEGEFANVVDLVIGGTSTASADFRVQGQNGLDGTLAGYTYGRRFIDIDSTGYYVEPGNTSTSGLFAGNVGIGTTLPGANLDINSSTTPGGILRLTNSDTTVTVGELSGKIEFYNLDSTEGPSVSSYIQSRTTTGGNAYALDFGVQNGATTDTKMTILPDGNVGIGTTAPTAKLEVTGDASASGSLVLRGSNPSTIDVLNGNRLGIQTSPGGDVGLTERFTILGNGNVGIGSAAPAQRLNINGGNVQINQDAADRYLSFGTTVKMQSSNSGANLDFAGGSNTSTTYRFWTNNMGSVLGTLGSTGLYLGGATAPANRLDVNGAAAVGTYAGTAGPSNGLIVSGNVGIGTTNPSSFKLQVAGDVGPQTDSTYNLGSLSLAWANIYGDTVYQGGNQVCDTSGNCTNAGLWQNTDEVLHPKHELAGVVDLVVGGTSTASADFRVQGQNGLDGTLAGYTYGRRFIDIDSTSHYVEPGNASIAGAFAGSVGIGITNPGYKLEVVGTGRFTGQLNTDAGLVNAGLFTTAGGITNINASSNFATNINTGTSNGALSLGGGSGTVAVNSTTWDISTTGVATGLTGITSSGSITFSGLTANRLVTTGTGGLLSTSISSANLGLSVSDETGNGLLVFNNAPTFSTGSVTFSGITTDITTVSNEHFNIAPNGTGNVGIGSTTPGEKLDIVGNVTATNLRNYYESRTLPTVVDDYIEVGTFVRSATGFNLEVSATVSDSGFSVAKRYLIPVQYSGGTAGTWYTAIPISDTGAYSSQNFALDVNWNSTGNLFILRLRRTAGATAGTARVHIQQTGATDTTFTASSATGSTTAPVAYWESTVLTQVDDNVGIGTTAPTQKLDVAGNLTLNSYQALFNSNSSGSNSIQGNVDSGGTALGSSNDFWLQSRFDDLVIQAGVNDSNKRNFTLRSGLTGVGLVMNGSGNIGIGAATAPAAALDVTGDTYVSGGISLYGTSVSDGTVEADEFCTGDAGLATCIDDFGALAAGSSIWSDGGPHVYTTNNEYLGNASSGTASQKITGLYLADSAPITFGNDNDVSFNFSGSTLAVTQGSNDINFDSDTLFIDGSADSVGIGTTAPSSKLELYTLSGTSEMLTLYNDYATTNNNGIIFNSKDSGGTKRDFSRIVSTRNGAQALLHFQIDNDNNLNTGVTLTNALTIAGGGSVGIGTTSPSYRLQLVAPAADSYAMYLQQDNANMLVGIDNTTAVSASNLTGFDFRLNTSTTTRSSSRIQSGFSNTTDASRTSFLSFSNASAGTFGEVMRIAGTNLGIGTTNPTSLLEVSSQNDAGIRISSNLSTSGGARDSQLFFRNSTTDRASIGYDVSGNALHFAVNGLGTITQNDASVGAAMTILSAGNVGIGTTTPTARLDIAGTASSSGTLAFRGTTDPKINVLNGEAFGIQTSPGGDTGLTERLTILNNGNIGIGSATPAQKLDLAGNITLNGNQALFNSNTSGSDFIQGDVDSGGTALGSNNDFWFQSRFDDVVIQAGVNDSNKRNLTLRSGLTGVGLVMNGSGNIGIGAATNPVAALDVTGDTYISGGLSLFETAVTDGTIEASKYCTGEEGVGTCVTDFSALTTGSSIWTDAGTYIYPTAAEVLGNSASAGSNKIAGIYLADSAPLVWGTDNDVTGTFSGSTLAFTLGSNDINFDSNTLFIDGSADSVGIGTTAPTNIFHVTGGSGIFRLSSSETNTTAKAGIYVVTHYTTAEEPLTVFRGYSDATTGQIFIGGGTAAGNAATHLRFYTAANNTTTTGTEKVVIDPTGNVGIGTTAPLATLHIIGPNNASGGIRIQDNSTDATTKVARVKVGHYTNAEEPVTAMLIFASSVSNEINYGGGSGAENAATTLNFYTGATTTTTTGSIRMMVNSSGSVGIGTIVPGAMLSVGSTSNFQVTSSGNINKIGNVAHGISDSSGALLINANSTANLLLQTNGGNTGIGTTATTALLDVAGNASSSGSLAFRGTADPKINILNGEAFGIRTSPGGDTGLTERVTILNNGNVGIGSATPGGLLDINTTSITSGIELDDKLALSGFSGDNYVRLNQNGDFTSGVYTPGNFRSDGEISTGSTDYGSYAIQTGGNGYFNGTLTVNTLGSATTTPVCIASGVLSSCSAGAVTGSGVADMVARWTGTNTLGTGVLYDNGTQVGINTTTVGTGTQLRVFQNSSNTGYDDVIIERQSGRAALTLTGDGDAEAYGEITFLDRATNHGWYQSHRVDDNGDMLFTYDNGTVFRDTLQLHVDGTATIFKGLGVGYTAPDNNNELIVSGSVGIGITNPGYKLEVVGTGRFTGQLNTDAGLVNAGLFTTAGGITNINASSNFATNINTGTSNGALSLGGGSGTVAVNSTTWDISTTGVATGLTGITSSGSITFSGLTADRLVTTGTGGLLGTSISSANLGLSVSDETGNGLLVFNNAPTFSTGSVTFSAITNDIITGTNEHLSLMPNGTGNVGIGTTTPDSKLHVFSASAGTVTALANSVLTLENSSTAYLSFLTPDANERGILFGEASSNVAGGIIYNNSAVPDGFQFRANGNSTKMIIDSNGNVGIGTTAATAKLTVSEPTALGGTLNNSQIIATIQGLASTNFVKQSTWLRRDAAGSDWNTARVHDGISVDGSFVTPGTDTRTWWERDPNGQSQSWGNATATYMSLTTSGGLEVGSIGYDPAAGSIFAGLIGSSYTPTAGTYNTTGSTLLLTGQDYSTIGFLDYGSRADYIRAGAGNITLGYDGGYGAANVLTAGNFYALSNAYMRGGVSNDVGDLVLDAQSSGFVDIRQANTTYGLILRQTGDIADFGNIEVNETWLGISMNSGDGALNITDGGNVGIGLTNPTSKVVIEDYTSNSTTLSVNGNTSSIAGALFVFNDGNNANRTAIVTQSGSDTGAGTSKIMEFYDGNATLLGDITFSGLLVSYNGFTGSHVAQLPAAENAAGYKPGSLVCTIATNLSEEMAQATYTVEKCAQPYQANVAGSYLAKRDDRPNAHQVNAVGDGQVLVTSENGSIKRGDSIVTSSYAGYGMKASKAGVIVATAVADWTPSASDPTVTLPNGQVIRTTLLPVYYYPGVYYPGPNTTFSSEGELVLNGNNGSYTATPVGSSALSNVFASAKVITGKVKAGIVQTQELVVENSAQIASLSVNQMTVAGQTLQEYIQNIARQEIQIAGTAQLATNSAQLTNLTVETATVSGNLAANNISAQTTQLGSLLAETATISGTLVADSITTQNLEVAGSTRLDILEARQAQLDQVRATTAELMDATVSGTLYATNIDGLQDQIAQTLQQPSFLDILTGNTPETVTGDPIDVYEVASSAGYDIDSDLQATAGATLSFADGDVILNSQAAYIEKYLQVNGLAYVADSLGVGNRIVVGNTTSISDGVIAFASSTPDNTLRVQPSGQGKLDFLAGLMTLEGGNVRITGNVYVAGTTQTDTLLTNLVQPADFGNPFQVQVAGVSTESGELKQSRFEIINELGTPVATISAQGKAAFAGGIGVGSETIEGPSSASGNTVTVASNKTSGKAKLLAGTTDLIIESDQITENSLVYVTPVGSTQNQVIYVKDQTAEQTNTSEKEGRFTVAVDAAISVDLSFNWWIVN